MSQSGKQSKALSILGWILSIPVALFMLFGGVVDILKVRFAIDGLKDAGLPESAAVPLGVVLLIAGLLYLIPRTAVLGAIILTGYLGGAVGVHVRKGDPVFSLMLFPVYFATVMWIALLLRERRLRAVLPLRGK